VKTVIFDFYGTLAEMSGAAPSFDDLLRELGYEPPEDAHRRWWNDGIDGTEHDEHSQSRDHYVAWQRVRMRRMLDECGVPACDHDLVIARADEISGHRLIAAYPEVPTVLAELRTRGCTLAVCSNWDWDLDKAIAGAGLESAFDLVVSSAWVGARKPHPRIYTHTLERLGIAAADAIFVGDTWNCDVAGPLAAGLRPVYLRRAHFGQDLTAPDHHVDDVVRAADLTVLLELVGK
jgi:putative hydrolase of the HAD superfamily